MDRKKTKIKKIIKEYINNFPSSFKIDGVFLFGSYATGKTTKDSDVDIIVISQNFKNIDFIKRMEMLSKYRKTPLTKSIAMDIIGYTPREFQKIDKESIIMRQAKKEGEMVRF